MSEDLKKLVEMPEHLRDILTKLPDEVANKCLEDTYVFNIHVESLKEMLEGLGFESYELEEQIISGLIQHYQPEP